MRAGRTVIGIWLGGLARRRPTRLAAAAAGIAVAVGLLASLGSFVAHSKATMTDRAIRAVAIDWQIQVASGADPAAVDAAAHSDGAARITGIVGYAQTSGLAATVAGPAPASCWACRTATAPRFRASSARWPAPITECCSPSRPPQTCTPPPGT
jgi:hypothetical protein